MKADHDEPAGGGGGGPDRQRDRADDDDGPRRPLENIAGDVPPSLRDVDALLARYARWATTGGRGGRMHTQDRMYVAESERSARYALDNRREAAYGAATREPLLPTQDALRVQRALAQVPMLERVVLAILYLPHRVPAWKRLSDLRVPPRLSQQRHIAGLAMLQNALRRAGVRGTSR